MFNKSGEQIATIGFNESYGLWQIVLVEREEIEFFCPSKEVAFAARKVIVVVEELVSNEVIRSDPNRTLIPGLVVDAVVVEPFGAHPSYVQGHYDRDNAFYLEWDRVSRDAATTQAWLREWVLEVPDRAAYLTKLGTDRRAALRPGPAPAAAVDYGVYR